MKRKLFLFIVVFVFFSNVNAQNITLPYLFINKTEINLGNVMPGKVISGDVVNLHTVTEHSYACWLITRSDRGFFTSVKNEGTEINHFCAKQNESDDFELVVTCPQIPGDFSYTLTFTHSLDEFNKFYVDFKGKVVGTDTKPPTEPRNLHLVSATTSSLTIDWDASLDNIKVHGYLVYINGLYHGFTKSTQMTISNLVSNTNYMIQVEAQDEADNRSTRADLFAATLPKPASIVIDGPTKATNYGSYTWNAVVHPGDILVAPYTYLWKYSRDYGNTFPHTFATTQSVTREMPYDEDFLMELTVTDANGISMKTTFLTVNTSGIHKSAIIDNKSVNNFDNQIKNINIFPNPVVNEINIYLPKYIEKSTVTIFNSLGKFVKKKGIISNKTTLDLSNEPDGVYIVVIDTGSGSYSERIIKK